MPTAAAQRVSIHVSSFPPRGSTAPRWRAGRAIRLVLGIWAVAAALLVAVIVAIVWDLRA